MTSVLTAEERFLVTFGDDADEVVWRGGLRALQFLFRVAGDWEGDGERVVMFYRLEVEERAGFEALSHTHHPTPFPFPRDADSERQRTVPSAPDNLLDIISEGHQEALLGR